VRGLSALRRATPALQGHASIRVVNEGYPFAYVRGETHLVVVNPRREPASLDARGSLLWGSGVEMSADELHIDGFGYGILTLPVEP
jgi:maltose alpha-D-glucosyltransferase/alpha-amylase